GPLASAVMNGRLISYAVFCLKKKMDGGRFPAASDHRTTSGLLFDEHVERVRDFCRDRVGQTAAAMATHGPRSRWNSRGRCRMLSSVAPAFRISKPGSRRA